MQSPVRKSTKQGLQDVASPKSRPFSLRSAVLRFTQKSRPKRKNGSAKETSGAVILALSRPESSAPLTQHECGSVHAQRSG